MADESFVGQNELIAQGLRWQSYTPSDTVDLEVLPKSVHICAGEGVFYAVDNAGTVGKFYGRSGDYPPIRPKRINATDLDPSLEFTILTG